MSSEFVPILTAAITGCTRCGCAVASPLIATHRKVCPGQQEQPPEVRLTVSAREATLPVLLVR